MDTRCRNRKTINIRNSTRTGKTIGWWRMRAAVTGRRLLVPLSRLPAESNFTKLCVWKEHARTGRWKFALCMTAYQTATLLKGNLEVLESLLRSTVAFAAEYSIH